VKKGKVYLIGAGPGDPGLITLKALECLARAEVVIYDHLVSSSILAYAPPQAEKIYAGKSAKMHFAEQDEINKLLVEKARQGKIVGRLKGGDPFVLGRGGEEAEALRENGIAFEIVPGITSAVAVPAYAGIPVTHRGLSSSVAIITGHEDPSKKSSSIRWDKLATATDTLVILMGRQNLPQITAKLIEHGRKPETPVAVIKDGTLPTQVALTGTLEDISLKVKKMGLEAPAVIVIGEVVKLRDKLRWFDNLPLFGKRILVTRASRQAGSFEHLLAQRGAWPVLLPVIEIKPLASNVKLDTAIKRIGHYNWIAFTSVNGVEFFFDRLRDLGLDSRALTGLKISAIGPATGKALHKFGISADYLPKTYTGRGFVGGLQKQGVGGQRFLLPRADIADAEITRGLKKLGAQVDEIAVYRTTRPGYSPSETKEMLLRGNIDVITFTSSSTVTNLVSRLGSSQIARLAAKIACIGPKTASTAVKTGLKVDIIAKEQTMSGLAEAIENYFRKEA
jgi:uroporphyrinogen III methyltransferase/synthase